MPEIIPSILVSNKKTFLEWSHAVESAVSMIQLDIADGDFVENITWADPETVAESLAIDCELHLMVKHPIEEARKWEQVPQVKRVYVHYESDPEHILDIVNHIHSYEWGVGVALNPETPARVLEELKEEIDAVLIMGVRPGRQGQAFIPETIDKLREIKKMYPNLFLALDGGVNLDTLSEIAATGLNAICPGSAIFGNERTPAENVREMNHAIQQLS